MIEWASQPNWQQSLYERKAPGLILYGRALGLSHSEAEDVLQETFLALLRLEVRPDEPEHYCLRAFRNRALNFRRSLWRRCARELESRHWFETDRDTSAEERRAMAALARLPREQREVIVLKIWNAQTFEAIARLSEISPHTAAGRYRYGMAKLRQWLKEDTSVEGEKLGGSFALLESA